MTRKLLLHITFPVAALLALAACGSASPTPTAPQVSTSISAAAPSPSAGTETGGSSADVPTPATSASAPATAAPIGSEQTLTAAGPDGQAATVTVTVHGYAPFTPENQFDAPDAGMQTVAVDAELCVSFPNTVQSMDRWVLIDSNNGRYQPEIMSSGPKPEYPYLPTQLTAGECIRGSIPFIIRADVPITTIRYATEKGGYTLRWTV